MRKIMFDEHFGLQTAVLRRTKDMTRRIEKVSREMLMYKDSDFRFSPYRDRMIEVGRYYDGRLQHKMRVYPRFHVGEKVAIAQSYKEILEEEYLPPALEDKVCERVMNGHIGCTNKMYVESKLMPHYITITDIKVERMQEISDGDCLREGIYERFDVIDSMMNDVKCYSFHGSLHDYRTPREAFAALIDMICGKGTWDDNPWVTAYSFKLD